MQTTFMLAFVLPVVLGFLILVVGGALWIWNSRHSKRPGQVEADDWPEVGGKVLAAHLGEHETRHSDKHGEHVDITYEPVVEYVYSVAGEEYHGSKVYPSDDSDFGQAEAQAIIDKYPANTYVPVRYDPTDPSNSSLEGHSPHVTHRLLVAAQTLIALGISVCCFTFFMMFILVGKIR